MNGDRCVKYENKPEYQNEKTYPSRRLCGQLNFEGIWKYGIHQFLRYGHETLYKHTLFIKVFIPKIS
uniref:Uncharacterized protein n=1 Tax=Romanomermis culicivorax TaxID=13658 RepID=A0A915IY98_ROMCU